MKPIFNKVFKEHDTGMHPENKKRLEVLESIAGIEETNIKDGEDYLQLVHTRNYIEQVKIYCAQSKSLDQDTLTSPNSYKAAIYAVGATIMASESNDFAIVRPPGHHAHADKASGFCIFNNIAIATQKLVNENKSVLIFDFDGHLGDGTFHLFKETDQVLYWSIHQYPAFPGEGSENQIGIGKGEGYTINVPLPPGSGDDIFKRAIERFLPVAQQFNPDVVAVSAGFDAHQFDLLLDLRLSLNAYYYLGKLLNKEFSNVFATLEGGYNVEYLPKCLSNFLNGFNGQPQEFTESHTESKILTIQEYDFRADQLENNLLKYWDL